MRALVFRLTGGWGMTALVVVPVQSVEDMEALERTIQALQHELDVTAKEHR